MAFQESTVKKRELVRDLLIQTFKIWNFSEIEKYYHYSYGSGFLFNHNMTGFIFNCRKYENNIFDLIKYSKFYNLFYDNINPFEYRFSDLFYTLDLSANDPYQFFVILTYVKNINKGNGRKIPKLIKNYIYVVKNCKTNLKINKHKNSEIIISSNENESKILEKINLILNDLSRKQLEIFYNSLIQFMIKSI